MADGPADTDAKVRTLLDALGEPALIVRAGHVQMANGPALALLGERIEGQDIRLAIRHPAAVERLLGPQAGRAGEIELIGVGEAERRWTMTIAPLEDGASFVRLTDRSEVHAAEQMRVDFVANASHELRSPLATLVGYAETLREQADSIEPATRDRFLSVVHDEALRMQRLVEDLISLSRLVGERFNAPREQLDLRGLVDVAREHWRHAAEERSSEIRVLADDGVPPISGERSQILQLIDNLIGNALRYGRAGSPVTVTLRDEGEMVRLGISDEGDGIAPEHIPRLTERFYRVDASRSRALGGTGLGLAIVKHIVERHRGRLVIQSDLGRGTSVDVLLPAAVTNLS